MESMISILILTGIFLTIGIYWTILAPHFLAWTRKYNESFHKFIDSRLAQPVLVERAKKNYARLEACGGITGLTWGVRLLGATLATATLVTISRLLVNGV
jgi:hypothetical protein